MGMVEVEMEEVEMGMVEVEMEEVGMGMVEVERLQGGERCRPVDHTKNNQG